MARRHIDLSYPNIGERAIRTLLTAPPGLDAEFGHRLAEMPAVCIDVAAGRTARIGADGAIDLRRIGELDFEGVAVLIRTGAVPGLPDRVEGPMPYLTDAAAIALLGGGAGLVGVDGATIDAGHDPARPASARLLSAGVPIVTGLLGLEGLRVAGFCFSVVLVTEPIDGPIPVRAFATIDDERYVG